MDLANLMTQFPVQFLTVLCVLLIVLGFLVGWLARLIIRWVNSRTIDRKRALLECLPHKKELSANEKEDKKTELLKDIERLKEMSRSKGRRYLLTSLPPIVWLLSPMLVIGAVPGDFAWEPVFRTLRWGAASWYMIPVALLFLVFVSYLWFGARSSPTYTHIFQQRKLVWFVFGLVVVGLLGFVPSTLFNASRELDGLHAMTMAAIDAIDDTRGYATKLEDAARAAQDPDRQSVSVEEYIKDVNIWARDLDHQLANLHDATESISNTVPDTFPETDNLTVTYTQQAISQINAVVDEQIQPQIEDVYTVTQSINQAFVSGTTGAGGVITAAVIDRQKVEELVFLADEINDDVESLQATQAVLAFDRSTPFVIIAALFVTLMLIPWLLYISFILSKRRDASHDASETLRDLGFEIEDAPRTPGNQAQDAANAAREIASQCMDNPKEDLKPILDRYKRSHQREFDIYCTYEPFHTICYTYEMLESGVITNKEARKELGHVPKESDELDVKVHAFHSREYVIPLVVLTVLTFIGWYYTIFPTASAGLIDVIQKGATLEVFTDLLTRNFTAYTMVFSGAWLFMIVMLTYRWVTNDLYPKSYFYASMRLVYALLVGLVFANLFNSLSEPLPMLPLLVPFFVGIAPLEFVRALWRWLKSWPNAVRSWIGRDGHRLATLVEFFERPDWGSKHPLTNLKELTIWDDTRLSLEGIQNVHALATADLKRLVLSTRFDAQQLLDWVDQAALFVHATIIWQPGLSAIGIRTATNLLDVCQDEDKTMNSQKVRSVVASFNHAQLMSLGADSPHHAAYTAASELEAAATELGDEATAVKAAIDKLEGDKPETLDNIIALRNEVSSVQDQANAAERARKEVYNALQAAASYKEVSTWEDSGTIASKLKTLTTGDGQNPSRIAQANAALTDQHLSRKKLEEDLEKKCRTAEKPAQKALEEVKAKVSALVDLAQQAKSTVEEAEENVVGTFIDVDTEKAKKIRQTCDAVNEKVAKLITKVADANNLAATLTNDTASKTKAYLDEAVTAAIEAKSAADDLVTEVTEGSDSFSQFKSAAEVMQTMLGDDLQDRIKTAKQAVELVTTARQTELEAAINVAKSAIRGLHKDVSGSPDNETVAKVLNGMTDTDIYKKLDALEKAREAKAEFTKLEARVTAANDMAKKLKKDEAATWDNVRALYCDLRELKKKVAAADNQCRTLSRELDAMQHREILALREAKMKINELSTEEAEKKIKKAEQALEPLSADDTDKLEYAKRKATDASEASKNFATAATDVAEKAMRTSLPMGLTEGILQIMLEAMDCNPNVERVRQFWRCREKSARGDCATRADGATTIKGNRTRRG